MKRICAFAMTLTVWIGAGVRADSLVVQTFELNPGWNPVYLEVEPEVNDIAAVFDGIAVESVWTRVPRSSTVEYIQDPSEGIFNEPGWLSWHPDAPAGVSNLFAVKANRAYLVKVSGSQSWTVTGRPSVRDIDWIPDSFYLTGLPVTPESSIGFADFLAPSPAHTGQPIFEIASDGAYEPVNASTGSISSGAAYWIFSSGASSYTGPLAVTLDEGDGLDYDSFVLEQRIDLRNLASDGGGVTVRVLDSLSAGQLAYWSLEPEGSAQPGQIIWPDLPEVLSLPGQPGEPIPCAAEAFTGGNSSCILRLAVQRAEFASNRLETVLEITDQIGTRRLIPVSALRRAESTASSTGQAAGETDLFAGLWVGTVEVNAVSEAQTGSPDPTPVSTAFSFRILVHVDGAGQARLLKQVIRMWEDGTTNDDGTLASPGRFVLLTDDALITDFKGATLRDGDAVGIRMSSAAYDLLSPFCTKKRCTGDAATACEQEGDCDDAGGTCESVACAQNSDCADEGEVCDFEPVAQRDLDGTFGLEGSLTATLVLPANAPTNPYRHKFHPDHDNLDASFQDEQLEAYAITRNITLSFSGSETPCTVDTDCPDGATCGFPNGGDQEGICDIERPPDWGDSVIDGSYQEKLLGLHRNDIVVEGTFRLNRVSDTPVLNQ